MPHVHALAVVAWMIGVPALAPSPAAHGTPVPPAASAPASPAAGPQLNIAVTDGRTAAAEGDRLTYTIRIRNLGTSPADGLRITQSLPAGLKFVSTDHGGAAATGRVTWVVSLKPGAEATLATVGTVEQTPSELLRLATVACAAAKRGDRPLVCATHSDLLPAGAAAAAKPPTPHGSSGLWYGIGAAMLVLVALGLVAVARTRRRRMRTTRGTGEAAGRAPGGRRSREDEDQWREPAGTEATTDR